MSKFTKIALAASVCFMATGNIEASGVPEDSPEYSANIKAYGTHMAQAAKIAQEEGRELHILLGATPGERHIQTAMASEHTKEEANNAFKAPIRIFFNKFYDGIHDHEISNSRTPIFFGDFNGLDDWSQITRFLAIVHQDEIFQGCVDKIYFDWSVVKFVQGWDEPLTDRILSLLKPAGSLFVPGVNLALDTSSRLTVAPVSEGYNLAYPQHQAQGEGLIGNLSHEQKKKKLPYQPAIIPYFSIPGVSSSQDGWIQNIDYFGPRHNVFLRGCSQVSFSVERSLSKLDKSKQLVTYRWNEYYNCSSLLNDHTFTRVDELQFEKLAGVANYPCIGLEFRDAEFQDGVLAQSDQTTYPGYLANWSFVRVSKK